MGPPIDPLFASVVVAVDGSLDGEEAVRQGARVAALAGASLELVHVFEGSTPEGGARRGADGILDDARRVAQHEAVTPRSSMLVGDAPSILEEEARRQWADLICVGTAAAHAGLGTVARHVLHRTHCSVLVSRAPRAGGAFPHRVLCAVDGSEGALEAVRKAAAITSLSEGTLRLVHVIGRAPEGVAPAGTDGAMLLEHASTVVGPWGVDPQREILVGTPGPRILDAADGWSADLIVLGSRGLHGLRRLLLGSVSEWVSGHAASSVLVSRPRPW